MAIIGHLYLSDVESKVVPLAHHKAGLQFTASGYGRKIPTTRMVKLFGRWRRVYVCQYSNAGTAYVTKGANWIVVRD